MRLALSLAAALAMVSAAPALADVAGDARFSTTTLDVSGHGEARVPPDMASIDLGVVSHGATAQEATAANAAAMRQVLASLVAAGLPERAVRTSMLSVTPQYAYPSGQAPQLTGFEADNQVTVTVDDLTRLGPIVDSVVKAGATNVGQIRFGLKAPGSAANFARLAAVKDMDDKAQVLADAAGYHLRRLVNLTENAVSAPGPVRPMYAMAARTETTPVESGEVTVSVDVQGEFELAH